jgi:hypothetical protein
VSALALALLSACGGLLIGILDAPDAGAVVLACTAPGIVVVLFAILRSLEGPADDATRRSGRLALVLLLVPLAMLIALAARLAQRPLS